MSEPSLEKRLERLERENRRLKRLGAVAMSVIAAMVLMGQVWQAAPSKVPKEIEAQRFIVRDATGKLRAAFGMSLDGRRTALAFVGAGERKRMWLGTWDDGRTSLRLFDTAERPRVGLYFVPDGGEGLAVLDDAKRLRATLMLVRDGKAALGLYDGAGKPRAGLAVLPDGRANLVLPEQRQRVDIKEMVKFLMQFKALGGL